MNVLPIPPDESVVVDESVVDESVVDESRRLDESTPRDAKIAGLDVVRAVAALGVVLLHSCVPYMQPSVPGLVWSVHDTPHWLVAECFWTVELFIMPLFLMLAGFFAWQTWQRSGSVHLIRTRAKRLLVPLAFGMVVILPLDLYAWLLGWATEGIIPLKKLRSLKFDNGIDRDLWGLSHLWFLQYLFLYVLVLAGGASIWQRATKVRSRRFRPGWVAALFGLVACVTLYVCPEVVWGFQHRFLPVPSKWIYSGVFFAFGALLAGCDGQLQWLQFKASRLASPSVAFGIAALVLGSWHLHGGTNQLASITLAVTTSISAIMITMAIIGTAAKRVRRVPTSLQYLAAASFWVYIVHHPILGLIHADLKWLLPTTSQMVKVAIAFALTSVLSLATYEVWVRQTALGHLLGFQWQLPRDRDGQPVPATDKEVISIGTRRGQGPAPVSVPAPISVPGRRAA